MSVWPCLSHPERSTSNISDPQTDVCLKRTSVQSYPRVKWSAKYNETQRIFFFLRGFKWENKSLLHFMFVRSSLSQQLDTSFLDILTLAADNCSMSSFWMPVFGRANTVPSHLKARRWEVFGKERNEVFSVTLKHTQDLEVNHGSRDNISTFYWKDCIYILYSDRKHLTILFH